VLEDKLIVELSKFFDADLTEITGNDRRTMPEGWRWSKVKSEEAGDNKTNALYADINQWLVVLLILTLVIERLVAWRRGQ
jgi:hypothetical protein